MENAQLMKQFMTQQAPATRELQTMVSRVVQHMPFSSFLMDKSYLDDSYLSRSRQSDRKAKPLVPALDMDETQSASVDEDPFRPQQRSFEDADPLRGGLRYLRQSQAHRNYNSFLKDVPFDPYVQMMGAQGAARGMDAY